MFTKPPLTDSAQTKYLIRLFLLIKPYRDDTIIRAAKQRKLIVKDGYKARYLTPKKTFAK